MMIHFAQYIVAFLVMLAMMVAKVDARLSLLRISQWHEQQPKHKTESNSDDGMKPNRFSLSSIASRGLPEDYDNGGAASPSLATENWGFNDQKQTLSELNRRRLGSERAIRELLAFGLPAFSHSYSYSFPEVSYSLSFDFSLSFPEVSFDYSLSFPEESDPPTAQPSSAPTELDMLWEDFSFGFSFSLSMNDGPPLVVTPAPSPSPMISTGPGPMGGTSAPTFPSAPSPTGAPTITSVPTIGVDGKNAGVQPTPDVPNLENGSNPSPSGSTNDEDELNDGSSGDKNVQATMISVLVGAAVAVGAAMFVRKWHQRAHGTDPFTGNHSEVSSVLSEGLQNTEDADLA